MFGLQGPEAYAYTSLSNCLTVQDIDDIHDYKETIVRRVDLFMLTHLMHLQKAMQVIGLSDQEQSEIFRMLATVLWLGNVQFDEMDDGNSTITDSGVTDFIAYLVDVDPSRLQKVLTSRVVETQRGGRRGSIYDVPLNPAQAGSGRDALAKAIYNNLFEWIVSRINVSMKPRAASAYVVGILVGFPCVVAFRSHRYLDRTFLDSKSSRLVLSLTGVGRSQNFPPTGQLV
jgi:myosin I